MLQLTRLFSYIMVTNLLTQNLPLKGTHDAPTPERQIATPETRKREIATPESRKTGNRDARTPEKLKSRRQNVRKTGNRHERNEKKREFATPETRKT